MIGERRVAAARPARGARVSDNGLRRYAAGQRLASGRHIQVTLRHHKRDIKKHLAATPPPGGQVARRASRIYPTPPVPRLEDLRAPPGQNDVLSMSNDTTGAQSRIDPVDRWGVPGQRFGMITYDTSYSWRNATISYE